MLTRPGLGLEASRGQNFVASPSRVLASAWRVGPRRGRGRGDNNNSYDIIILKLLYLSFTIEYIDFMYVRIGWRFQF